MQILDDMAVDVAAPVGGSAGDAPGRPSLLRGLLRGTAPLLSALWLVGIWPKDRWFLTRLCYYIPPIVVVLVGLIWLLAYRRRRDTWLRVGVGLVSVAAAAKLAFDDTRWTRPIEPPADAIRVVHWNTAWGEWGNEQVWQTIGGESADLVILSEPPHDIAQRSASLRPLAHWHAGAAMALLSRWPIDVRGSLVVPGVRSWHIRVATPKGPLDVLGVDLVSNPFIDRGPALRHVARWVMDHDSSVPLLIVGDFNTPRDSRFLDPLRGLAKCGYESAGSGWPYSWPWPVPLWSIDQVWHTTGVQVLSHRFAFASCSDHLRQVMLLRLADAP